MRHIQGDDRQQGTLFPESLDDYVTQDNPIRVIDAFMDTMDMASLDFTKAQTKSTGRKPYDPRDMLKLYVYGYLNQVRSTRRLEKECHRNVEVLWLMKRLAPDFKTIANFRKENSAAIRHACQAFIQFCRDAKLLTSRLVAIDGSKFKAAASMSRTYNRQQLDALQKQLTRKIEGYLHTLATSEDIADEENTEAVQAALTKLQKRQQRLSSLAQSMDEKNLTQCCETDPEAKRMRSGREGIVVGYNVQTAVDDQTGLIVHHEVVDEGVDNRQLEPMAKAAQKVLQTPNLQVMADAGYSNGEQLARCEDKGIVPIVPPNRATNNQGDHFQKKDFVYDHSRDVFICPAGETLRYQTYSRAKKMHLYARTGCQTCAKQALCTKADKRWVSRHFYEEALERSAQRVAQTPGIMRRRSAVVERPFAQIKHTMGMRRFQCWGKKAASAEMGLSVLAYNLNRLINLLGVNTMMRIL